jgi:excisionase family DNA binding protein
MPPKIKPDNAQKTINTKNTTSNIMDNAPLFAGLEDFVLIQAERKEAKAPPVAKQKEKKSTVKKKINKTKKTNTAASRSQPATKVPKPVSIDPDAVLLSVAETCSLLKISRATLIRMDKSGLLPGRIKMGGSVRFHRETVVNWLQSLISTHPAP